MRMSSDTDSFSSKIEREFIQWDPKLIKERTYEEKKTLFKKICDENSVKYSDDLMKDYMKWYLEKKENTNGSIGSRYKLMKEFLDQKKKEGEEGRSSSKQMTTAQNMSVGEIVRILNEIIANNPSIADIRLGERV
jgi:hypothetical protein